MQDLRKRVLAFRNDERVNRVRRDDKVVQAIALGVEMSQGIFDKLPDIRQGQDARASARIEPLLQAVWEEVVILTARGLVVGLRMLVHPLRAFFTPEIQFLSRERVVEAEGDEVSDSLLAPVRQIAAQESDGGFWVKIVYGRVFGRALPAFSIWRERVRRDAAPTLGDAQRTCWICAARRQTGWKSCATVQGNTASASTTNGGFVLNGVAVTPGTLKLSITIDLMKDPALNPVHPDEILSKDFLAPLGISQYRLAKDIHVPSRRVNEIVLERRGISADTALRLARCFRTTPQFWLNLQTRFELDTARLATAATIEETIRPAAALAKVA